MMQEVVEEFQQCLRYLAGLSPDNILFIGDSHSSLLKILRNETKVTVVSYSEIPSPGEVKPFLALRREEIYPLGMRYKLIVIELVKGLDVNKLLWTHTIL